MLDVTLVHDGFLIEASTGEDHSARALTFADLALADRGNPFLVEIRRLLKLMRGSREGMPNVD